MRLVVRLAAQRPGPKDPALQCNRATSTSSNDHGDGNRIMIAAVGTVSIDFRMNLAEDVIAFGARPMKTLLIFRHAQAVHFGDTSDHERPLTEKGVRDARRMGRLLRGMQPEQVLCSTAQRAQRTAQEALAVANSTGNIQTTRQLYDSDLLQHLNVLQAVPVAIGRLLIVGHNPTLETLATRLAHRPMTMKTGALAVLALPVQHWEQLTEALDCELVGLFYPAMLKKRLDSDEV